MNPQVTLHCTDLIILCGLTVLWLLTYSFTCVRKTYDRTKLLFFSNWSLVIWSCGDFCCPQDVHLALWTGFVVRTWYVAFHQSQPLSTLSSKNIDISFPGCLTSQPLSSVGANTIWQDCFMASLSQTPANGCLNTAPLIRCGLCVCFGSLY